MGLCPPLIDKEKYEKVFYGFIGPVAAGCMVTGNLIILYGYNENYEAALWRVILGVIIGLGCWVVGKQA